MAAAVLACVGLLEAACGASAASDAGGQLAETLRVLASFGDRSTGTPGNGKAAAFIKTELERLEIGTVGSQQFAVPVIRYGESTLSIPARRLSLPIHPIAGNAITPQTISTAGLTGPLLYVGSGELSQMNQTALLNSISHDLRTPLVSITGALTSLDDQSDMLDEENRRNLIITAREEADRLNRLVGNLLSMTRIESGAIKLHNEPGDIEDLIGTALEQLGKRLGGHDVKVQIPSDFPLVPMDFTLMVQVVVNVLDNAVKYSPDCSLIEVSTSLVDQKARIQIADCGVGIPPDDLTRIFDKFYRVQRAEKVNGTGLGLSISKGIVEAHHGNIYASAREGGGTVITIELPLS